MTIHTSKLAKGFNPQSLKTATQGEVGAMIAETIGGVAVTEANNLQASVDAISRQLGPWFADMSEEELTQHFSTWELSASNKDRALIAAHPQRPAAVEAIVAKALEEEKARKQEERRQRKIEALQKRLAAREEDERKLAELEAEAAGGKAAVGDTPNLKAASTKAAGKSGDAAEA